VTSARVIETPEGYALDMPCSRSVGFCNPRPPVHRGESYVDEKRGRVWQWIGPAAAPTIKPSVGCDHKCGQHRVITNGSWA
jgi:hypothetical protein